ncbi:SidA/IucD/PvdA family monooxygenase [Paraburkholderia humisilvae]|uniref:L-lysine N(6)-monooxygenase (NADPH) n=1 Tax=Paraburkholderia humisilvae TaxID=627669 RepID=A0A6J5F9X1_9BURK|nr:SidA/IucD/PvdA family monooxygenase [Paraburkholderia humisilvae]CAB3775264.1 hypothetical protein LMG29542_08646 [Paraburkholderia humisilvae]
MSITSLSDECELPTGSVDAAKNPAVLDFIAIGLGPFNLSLACLADPIRDLHGRFLERNQGFDWHPGMLIDDTTLQNPFLADLVSLADPKSKFSFLNYCKQEGKLYAYYIRERFYLSREEYNRYCKWAISQLSSIDFGSNVDRAEYDLERGHYIVSGRRVGTGQPFMYRARRIVVGVGSVPLQLPTSVEGEFISELNVGVAPHAVPHNGIT